MESNIAALRGKNDIAAAKELRELRADTIAGLKYLLTFENGDFDECIENALAEIERVWRV